MREQEEHHQANAQRWLEDRTLMQEKLAEWEAWYDEWEEPEAAEPEDGAEADEEVFTEGARRGATQPEPS
eukprot:1395562-Alexandrium_andersonii.AAC.1